MIRKLLGHSDFETTARYAYLARGSIHGAAERTADNITANILWGHRPVQRKRYRRGTRLLA